jgi:regulator of sigma E protease
MLTLLAFVFTLGLLITIHEYGHFIVARMFNVKVLRFSIGFGNPIWQTQFGQDKTELVIAAIPLGGYVKMLDEREIEEDKKNGNAVSALSESELQRAFNRLPVLKRMAVVVAGPVANLLLAIFLYWILLIAGTMAIKPIVGVVPKDSIAASAGFKENDLIQSVNGKIVKTWQDVRWEIMNLATEKSTISVQVTNQQYGNELLLLNAKNIDFENTKIDLMDQFGLVAKQPEVPAKIGEIVNHSAAERAGLKSGDIITAINQQTINTWEEFVLQIKSHPNQPMNLRVMRNQININLTITPDAIDENGKKIGRIGAGVQVDQEILNEYLIEVQETPFSALQKACQKTWETSIFSLKMLGKMLIGEVSWKMMSGPVTIASYAGQSAHMGIKIFIGFLALMSISIGVLNLLPIPVLDGGHLMYYMVEFFTGRPVSESVLVLGQKVGVFLIGSMTVLALFNDISRVILG